MVETSEKITELVDRADEDDYVVLSGGQRLRLQGVPMTLVQKLNDLYPQPPAPWVEVEIDGQKTREPNPNDPDWLAACDAQREAKNTASVDLALVKGVIVDVPPGDGWLEDMDTLGLPRPDVSSNSKRRLAYLRHELLKTAADLTKVVQAVYRLTTVTEEAIAAAASQFRREVQGS